MDGMLILLFVVSISLPLLGCLHTLVGPGKLDEKRILARPPKLGQDPLRKIPELFEAFYNDHFFMRSALITGHNWLRYKFSNGSSFGELLIGNDGWLYYAKKNMIPDFLGQAPLAPDELRAIRHTLEQRQQLLSEKGIHFMAVVAPNKMSVYPEHLPDHIRKFPGTTRLDQLSAYLRDHESLVFVDLRQALLTAKAEALLYHPKDTHWNDGGGLAAYQEICRRLRPWIPRIEPAQRNDFRAVRKPYTGDLALLSGLGDDLAEETVFLEPIRKRTAQKTEFQLPRQYPWPRHIDPDSQTMYRNENADLRLLCFIDSFGDHGSFRQYLSEHFKESFFVPAHPTIDMLERLTEKLQPDIVIYEFVERNLEKNLPPQP